MASYLCPKCFEEHRVNHWNFSCENSECDCYNSVDKKPVKVNQPLTIGIRNKAVCKKCNQKTTTRLCPRCNYVLPSSTGITKNRFISLVGLSGSGKSTYLSVLIEQIRNEMGNAYGCSLYNAGDNITDTKYETNYYIPLYKNKECISKTDTEDIDPLNYSILFSGEQNGKTSTISFIDRAGKIFNDTRNSFDKFPAKSDGLIFFIDPLNFTKVNSMLKKGYDPAISSNDIDKMLLSLITLIRKEQGLNDVKRKIQIPVAVVISKLDTITSLLDVSSNFKNQSANLQSPNFDIIEFNNSNLEMQSLINEWSDKILFNQINTHFEYYGFFGISSLGTSPNEEGKIGKINPFRIIDPFLWILWQNGIIRGK